jgi:predicted HAD superfamily Cof-like phosphohydrolase
MNTPKTNFEKVQEFNRAFDMAPKQPAEYTAGYMDYDGRPEFSSFVHLRKEIITDQPKVLRLRLDLIKEEINELNDAVKANDIIETRDALADILYVAYGMGDVLGIHMDSLVHSDLKIMQPTTLANGMQIFNTIFKYGNQDETNGKFVGLTNYNWMQIYMELFPDVMTSESLEEKRLAATLAGINASYQTLETEILAPNAVERIGCIVGYLARIVNLVYVYTILLGVDADADFAIVHTSNMSKLCDTESDAQATVADYEAKWAAGNSPYDSPYYYELPELGKWIVKNKSTGKALKNIKYRKVQFV